MRVGDWRLASGQMNEQKLEDPAEIDEFQVSINSGIKPCDTEYVLEENDQVEIEVGDGNGVYDVGLEIGDLEDRDDDLTATEWINMLQWQLL